MRQFYANINILPMKFSKCSPDVKCMGIYIYISSRKIIKKCNKLLEFGCLFFLFEMFISYIKIMLPRIRDGARAKES